MDDRAAVATLATAATAFALPASAHALALSVTTENPQAVTTTQATLRATVSVSALGGNVVWQYGTTTRYGTTSAAVATGLLGINQTLTLTVAGLAPETTYHVRAVATSGLSTAYGRDVSFTTARVAPSNPDDGSGDTGGSGLRVRALLGLGLLGLRRQAAPSPSTTTTTTTSTTLSAPKSPSSSSAGKTPTSDDAGTAPSADDGATVAPGVATATVTPSLGKTLGVAAVRGTVTATSPSGAPLDLGAAKVVPTGTVIDTRAGTVELKTALDTKGATQTGYFWGSQFEVRQSARDRAWSSSCCAAGTSRTARPPTRLSPAPRPPSASPPRSSRRGPSGAATTTAASRPAAAAASPPSAAPAGSPRTPAPAR